MMKRLLGTMLALLPSLAVAQENLIGGQLGVPGQFPGVFRINTGGGYCTATLVGPKAIITAAHCATSGRATFTLKGVGYSATVTQAPLYRGEDLDVAMGVINASVSGVPFASVTGVAKTGEKLVLVGTGVYTDAGAYDGRLRWGKTTMTGLSGLHDLRANRGDGAILGEGDSGGPVFRDSAKPGYDTFQLVAVNSKVLLMEMINGLAFYRTSTDFRALAEMRRVASLLTQTGKSAGQKFIQEWAAARGVAVCGVTMTCGIDVPPPTPTPVPSPSPQPTPVPPTPTPTPRPMTYCRQAIAEFSSILFSNYDLEENRTQRKAIDAAWKRMDWCKDKKKDGYYIE